MFEDLSKEMSRRKILALTAAAAVIMLSGAVAALESQLQEQERTLEMSATVESPESARKGNNTTFGINTGEKLNLGNITYNTNFTRFLELQTGRKSILKLSSTGNISEITYYTDEFYFEGNKTIPVTLGSKNPGRYEGKLRMKFQIPESKWGARWLAVKHRYF